MTLAYGCGAGPAHDENREEACAKIDSEYVILTDYDGVCVDENGVVTYEFDS
jgi:hypothetical protein